MNASPEPMTPEERELAQRLARLGPHEGPSPALDARILAAAHDAVAGARARDRRAARRRWPVALGAAASLALAVGVAWQLRPVDEAPVYSEADAAAEANMGVIDSAPDGGATDAAASAASAAVVPPEPEPPSAARTQAPAIAAQGGAQPETAPTEDQPIVFEDASPARSVAPAPSPPPPAPAAAPAFVPSPPAASDLATGAIVRQRESSEKREAARRAEAKTTAAEAEAASESGLDRISVTGSRTRDDAAAAAAAAADQPLDDQPPASADSLVVQRAWLQRIRDLVAEGRGDEALDSLQEFRRRYPDAAVPDDLRRLVPAAAP